MAERRSRSNTLGEKRKMRNDRKRRRRSRAKVLEAQLQHERALRSDADKKVTLYRNMSRSYWERWQWELQQRKEVMARERTINRGCQGKDVRRAPSIHELILNCYTTPLTAMTLRLTLVEAHLVLFESRFIVA